MQHCSTVRRVSDPADGLTGGLQAPTSAEETYGQDPWQSPESLPQQEPRSSRPALRERRAVVKLFKVPCIKSSAGRRMKGRRRPRCCGAVDPKACELPGNREMSAPDAERSPYDAMTTTSLPQLAAPLTAGFSHSYAAIILLLAAHFLFLAIFFAPAISTPDANGYMAQARLIARRRGRISSSSHRRSMWGTTGWRWARKSTTVSIHLGYRHCSPWYSGRWAGIRRYGCCR